MNICERDKIGLWLFSSFFTKPVTFFSLRSQNEKQDSEMMAVRTADKLLKVNVVFVCVVVVVVVFLNW